VEANWPSDFVAAALAGLIASLGPARKAARMDVLRAIAYE
jgi:ABC-type antimicrobial peptide transport system permease subunit